MTGGLRRLIRIMFFLHLLSIPLVSGWWISHPIVQSIVPKIPLLMQPEKQAQTTLPPGQAQEPALSCPTLANDGDCHFYTCYNKKKDCTSIGYNLAYGEKFCSQLQLNRDKFDANGKSWNDCVRLCLTKALSPYAEANNLTCSDIMVTGFGTHAKCYTQCGICNMAVNNTIALAQTYDMNAFMNPLLWKEILVVMGQCTPAWQDDLQTMINGEVNKVMTQVQTAIVSATNDLGIQIDQTNIQSQKAVDDVMAGAQHAMQGLFNGR